MLSSASLSRCRAVLLGILIVFLPVSAWLVSVSGWYQIGLIRDGLLIVFVGLTLAGFRSWQRPNATVWLALLFILAALMSFLTKEDSLPQFIRGVRFLIEPLLLYTTIALWPPVGMERVIWRTLAISVLLVTIGAVLDWFFPGWLRLTFDATARGYLGQVHLAGEARRLQSTLAGPNALGLFLMTALLLAPLWFSKLARPVAISVVSVATIALLLTFSRSSFFGLFIGLSGILLAGRNLLGRSRSWLWGLLGSFLVAISILLITSPQTLTRVNSNTARFEQYQRVWAERQDIGFWGRGAGAAGLSSVDRIDGGPNYFTENTYLDAYEATGPLGLIAYTGFWLWLIVALWRRQTLASVTAGAAALGLFAAGFFINHYTGQAAIWLTLIATATALAPPGRTS